MITTLYFPYSGGEGCPILNLIVKIKQTEKFPCFNVLKNSKLVIQSLFHMLLGFYQYHPEWLSIIINIILGSDSLKTF